MMGLTGFNPWTIAINQHDSIYLNQQPRVHHVGGRYVDLLCHRLLLRENCCENVTGYFGSSTACRQFNTWAAASERIPAPHLVQSQLSQNGQKRTLSDISGATDVSPIPSHQENLEILFANGKPIRNQMRVMRFISDGCWWDLSCHGWQPSDPLL